MDEGLLVFLVLITLLLAMFLYAVVTTPPQQAVAAERPPREPPPLPARRPPASALPAGAASQPGDADYAARHTPAAAATIPPPKVASPPRTQGRAQAGPATAGTVLTVIGGWLLIGTGKAATPCSHQGGALCSQGLVILTGTQLLGGAIILVGVALIFTTLARALRVGGGPRTDKPAQSEAGSRRCGASTSKGSQCKLPAEPGAAMCAIHAHRIPI
jgi:hypothetical protein